METYSFKYNEIHNCYDCPMSEYMSEYADEFEPQYICRIETRPIADVRGYSLLMLVKAEIPIPSWCPLKVEVKLGQ